MIYGHFIATRNRNPEINILHSEIRYLSSHTSSFHIKSLRQIVWKFCNIYQYLCDKARGSQTSISRYSHSQLCIVASYSIWIIFLVNLEFLQTIYFYSDILHIDIFMCVFNILYIKCVI